MNGCPLDPCVWVAHHHPGRLRIRSPLLELDARLGDDLVHWLKEQPGVRFAGLRKQTGSVLLTYEPTRVDAGRLLADVAERARLAIVDAPSAPRPSARTVVDVAKGLDEYVSNWSGGRFGLRMAVPVTLAMGSVASFLFSARPRAPRWDNLLYWSAQFFCMLNSNARPAGRTSDA